MNSADAALLNRHLQEALAAEQRGDSAAAANAYRAVLRLDASHPGALYRCAQIELSNGGKDQALAMFAQAINSARTRGLANQSLPIHTDRIIALRTENAELRLRAVREALADCGEVPGLIWEECECLRALGFSQERLQRLNRLAALQPKDAVILAELGRALLRSNSAPQAMLPMRQAIALGYDDPEFALQLAASELQNNEFAAAKTRIEKILLALPDHFGALGLLWHLAAQSCDWQKVELLEPRLLSRIDAGDAHAILTPWRLLASDASPIQLRDYARAFSQLGRTTTTDQPRQPLHAKNPRGKHARIRVGYLSSDFHRHATALLMAGLFDHHDKAIFEIYAYSYGARVDDEYRTRMRERFDHWHELNELSDAAAAKLIASHEIDVLIEMKGHTYGVRPGIVALRPASIQAHYLGYPGTLALEGIDFLIADSVVAPPEHDEHFVERVVRLPICYQANDDRRERPAVTPRAALGLPDDAILLCNFNQSWKWSRPFVEVWLNALARHPRALLWLLDPGANHPTKQNVAALATTFGVADRIHWAPQLPPGAHLARLAQADLALDQLPCNSHTTASDALWMGVPVLTCIGDRFDGRVAASLLLGVDKHEFIVQDIVAYRNRLERLLAETDELRLAKQSLVRSAKETALFDTLRFSNAWAQTLNELAARAESLPAQ
jgi:protein O-GlcNAc transferase